MLRIVVSLSKALSPSGVIRYAYHTTTLPRMQGEKRLCRALLAGVKEAVPPPVSLDSSLAAQYNSTDSQIMEGVERAMRRRAQIVLLILTLLFIWGHSMMPADTSSSESGAILELIRSVLGWDLSDHFIRKTAHFTEFALLGAQLYLLLKSGTWAGAVRPVGAGFTAAFLDETIQLFSPGRAGRISDVWLDTAGVVFGAAAAWVIVALKRRKKASSPS